MRLYIPACGDRITLSAPWTFDLYLEHRNVEFAKTRSLVPKDAKLYDFYLRGSSGGFKQVSVTLEPGTVIECDRVYVRTFSKAQVDVSTDYDSITWKVIGPKGKAVPRSRFWVKLPDTYAIEYDAVEMYRDRVKLVRAVMES